MSSAGLHALKNYPERERRTLGTQVSSGTRVLYSCLLELIYRRRQWHPIPVLLPGKSHGRRSLVGCSPWGHEESDTTATSLSLSLIYCYTRKLQVKNKVMQRTKTRHITTVTKGITRNNNRHKARRQSISCVRGS